MYFKVLRHESFSHPLPESTANHPCKQTKSFLIQKFKGIKTEFIGEVPKSTELERGLSNEKSKCIDLSKFKLHLHARVIKEAEGEYGREKQSQEERIIC